MPRIKNISKAIPFIPVFLVLVVPLLVSAQDILPKCGDVARGEPECGFVHLIELVNNIIKWLIWISIPISAGVFAWAGFKYMTSGVIDQKKEAITMIRKVFIGFVFILAAWLIVNTILDALLKPEFRENIKLNSVNSINLYA